MAYQVRVEPSEACRCGNRWFTVDPSGFYQCSALSCRRPLGGYLYERETP